MAFRSLVCRLLLPARAVLACSTCSSLAMRVFLFLVRASSSPSLAVVDVRSAAGWPLPCVPVPLESTWLFKHAVLPAVRYKHPRSIRAAIAATDLLPRLLLTRLSRARREGLQDRMTRAHARSDCVLNKGRKTDRLIYTSRFVHVIDSSCILLIRPGTVT